MRLVWLIPLWFAAGALAISGCAPIAPITSIEQNLPPPREGTIARFAVDGPNAYLNGQRVTSGGYVSDGDEVATGPGTSAILLLNQGGYIQLDENTDPLFKEGFCLLMKIFHGQVLFSNTKCLEVETVNMAVVAHSMVNIKSSEQETQMTVIDGRVEVRSPTDAELGKFDEYVAARDGTAEVRRLTPEEASGRVRWIQRYFHMPVTQKSGGISPGLAAAIGAFIGGVISIIRDDKPTPASPSGRQKPQTDSESSPQRPPTSSRGWCCVLNSPNTDLFPIETDANTCANMEGKFYSDENEARKACQRLR